MEEKLFAFQSQNLFLSGEVDRLEQENKSLKNTTLVFNDQLHSELSDYRKGYKILKHKLAVISSTVAFLNFYYYYYYYF